MLPNAKNSKRLLTALFLGAALGLGGYSEAKTTMTPPFETPAPQNFNLRYTGVNLAGLEFGKGNRIGTDYIIPGKDHYDYWAQQAGANIVRLPFKWERLQPMAYADLNPEYLSHLRYSVDCARENGMTIILDLHNYARYHGALTDAAKLGDVWTRLGREFGNNPAVWFNLMNEPHGISAQQWKAITQQVVDNLRASGITNKLLLSGTAWSGAHSWISSGNAAAYADFRDPLDNYAFDVHQYLDADSSGLSGQVVEGYGATSLIDVTQWAKANGHKLFLGETGAADDSRPGQQFALSEMAAMVEFMEDHNDTWLGWALWGAGPWWPRHYVFNINPDGLGTKSVSHSPIITDLMPWLPARRENPAVSQQPEPRQNGIIVLKVMPELKVGLPGK